MIERIERLASFVEEEVAFINGVDEKVYKIKTMKRAVAKAVENVVQGLLDIAGIVLVNREKPVPERYKGRFFLLKQEKIIPSRMACELESLSMKRTLPYFCEWEEIEEMKSRIPVIRKFLHLVREKIKKEE